MERQVQDLNERIQEQEDKINDTHRAKRQVEQECGSLKRNVSDLEMSVRKAESEKQAKDHQIRSLQVSYYNYYMANMILRMKWLNAMQTSIVLTKRRRCKKMS